MKKEDKKHQKDESMDEEEEDDDYGSENQNSGSGSEEDDDFDVKNEENDDDEEEDEEDDDDEEQKQKQKSSGMNNKRKIEVKNEEDEENGQQLKKKVKKENNDDDEDEEEELIKWKYLEHHGVLFPDYWQRHNIRIKYNGQPVDNLTIYQEEIATYWAQTMGTDYEHEKKIYRNNFIKQWMKTWKNNKEYTNFEKFDFQPIKDYLEIEKQKRKDRTKEEKQELKKKQEAKDSYYGYAIIDGEREKIGGYLIEPPTLFKGRGEHPKAGLLKARIMPEQLTINVAEDAPVPKCQMPGHCWKEIVHKNDVTWLGGYKDDTINKTHKYIQMAATSKFKSQNDIKKYERARRLKQMVQKVREDYQVKMNRINEKDKQLGTATYLIDYLALRVGNEKGEDEADTVGCCSLRVEHVEIQDDNKIKLKFLGKDSMLYENTVQVTKNAWDNLKQFQQGKNGKTDLFDRIQASDLNEYLKTFMEDLSAKVFRTYNASNTLQNELGKIDMKKVDKMTVEEKQNFYDNAVKQVAILCNHQKTSNKNFDIQTQKIISRIQIYQNYNHELEAFLKKFKSGKPPKAKEESVILEHKEDGNHKMLVKKFPDSKEKCQNLIKQNKNKIEKDQNLVDKRNSNKDIALGTSKTNYNDPRVTTSWCKRVDQPIEKPFPKTLRDKFLWAMDIEPDYEF